MADQTQPSHIDDFFNLEDASPSSNNFPMSSSSAPSSNNFPMSSSSAPSSNNFPRQRSATLKVYPMKPESIAAIQRLSLVEDRDPRLVMIDPRTNKPIALRTLGAPWGKVALFDEQYPWNMLSHGKQDLTLEEPYTMTRTEIEAELLSRFQFVNPDLNRKQLADTLLLLRRGEQPTHPNKQNEGGRKRKSKQRKLNRRRSNRK